MTLPTKPYTFANGPGNTADALQVNANFDQLYGALSAGGLDPAVFANGILPVAKLAADARAKPGVALASGDYTLTTSWADVPGVSVAFTPPVVSLGIFIGIGAYRFSLAGAMSGFAQTRLVLDGTPIGFTGRGGAGIGSGEILAAEGQAMSFALYYALTAAPHTIKLQAKCGSQPGFLDRLDGDGNPMTGLYYVTLPS